MKTAWTKYLMAFLALCAVVTIAACGSPDDGDGTTEITTVADGGSTLADGDKITTPAEDDETTTPMVDDETTTPMVDDETTTLTEDDEVTTPAEDDETTTPAKDDETTPPASGAETDDSECDPSLPDDFEPLT